MSDEHLTKAVVSRQQADENFEIAEKKAYRRCDIRKSARGRICICDDNLDKYWANITFSSLPPASSPVNISSSLFSRPNCCLLRLAEVLKKR